MKVVLYIRRWNESAGRSSLAAPLGSSAPGYVFSCIVPLIPRVDVSLLVALLLSVAPDRPCIDREQTIKTMSQLVSDISLSDRFRPSRFFPFPFLSGVPGISFPSLHFSFPFSFPSSFAFITHTSRFSGLRVASLEPE